MFNSEASLRFSRTLNNSSQFLFQSPHITHVVVSIFFSTLPILPLTHTHFNVVVSIFFSIVPILPNTYPFQCSSFIFLFHCPNITPIHTHFNVVVSIFFPIIPICIYDVLSGRPEARKGQALPVDSHAEVHRFSGKEESSTGLEGQHSGK